jgi:putative hemolysin
MTAQPTSEQRAQGRDFDEFDPYCEHLVVINHELGSGPEAIVGTYRMLRREGAEQVGRFYSADEYDISRLVSQPGDIMEMGRSCIDAAHRTRAAMQLMWRGIAAYIFLNKIDYLFGCASFQGTDPDALALPMSYLAYNHLAPEHFRPVAIPERYVDMRRAPENMIDTKQAVRHLPPMIRGYLRLGGVIGDGAVIDYVFNTVDVCVVVAIETLSERYLRHYLRDIQSDTGD